MFNRICVGIKEILNLPVKRCWYFVKGCPTRSLYSLAVKVVDKNDLEMVVMVFDVFNHLIIDEIEVLETTIIASTWLRVSHLPYVVG